MSQVLFRDVRIVGNSYRDEESQDLFANLEPGEEITLRPVTDNEFDSLACEVWAGDIHLGFLPKEVSGVIHFHPKVKAVVSQVQGTSRRLLTVTTSEE